MFHLQNETQLNKWLELHGVARLQEMHGLSKEHGDNIFALYSTIQNLKNELAIEKGKVTPTADCTAAVAKATQDTELKYKAKLDDMSSLLEAERKRTTSTPKTSSSKNVWESKKVWVTMAGMIGYVVINLGADPVIVTDISIQVIELLTHLGIIAVPVVYTIVQGEIDKQK